MKTRITKVGFSSMLSFLWMALSIHANSNPELPSIFSKVNEITFAENNCQIKDYNGKTNKKVLFIAQSENVNYLFRKDGISLQMPESTAIINPISNEKIRNSKSAIQFQKIEISWEGMNKGADIYGSEELNTPKPLNSNSSKDCQIRNYRKLYYSEIYPGIDLRYCDNDNRLKFDLLVHAGFNYKEIKMNIDSAKEVYVNTNGLLIIKTELGEIWEDAPLVSQNGKPLIAKWVVNNTTVSLDIVKPDPTKEINIQSTLYNNYYKDLKL